MHRGAVPVAIAAFVFAVVVYFERYSCKDSDGYSRTCYRQVRVYSTISWQNAQPPRAIDVYIEGKLYNRVHY